MARSISVYVGVQVVEGGAVVSGIAVMNLKLKEKWRTEQVWHIPLSFTHPGRLV